MTWDDFIQYYSHTFFRAFFPLLEKKIVLLFEDVLENRNQTFIASSQKFKRLILRFNSDLSIDFSMPPLGIFDHAGRTYFLARIPERQWSRGICNKNSIITSPLAKLGVSNIGHSLPVMESIWNHVPTNSISQGILEIQTNELISRSISRDFWISLGFNENEYALWYQCSLIGRLSPQEQIIKVDSKLLLQEVVDYIRDSNQRWIIE